MDQSDYLTRLMPHRLDALSIAELMLEFRLRWEEPRPMEILVDGKRQFKGLTSMFTNPIFEIAILNVRALMEFVGLKASGSSLNQIDVSRRKRDDIGIEMFTSKAGPLPLVRPEEVGAAHPHDPALAQLAVASAIGAANKGLAHFTDPYSDSPVEASHVVLACQVTQRVIERHFYMPLGAQRPPLPVEAERP